MHFDAHVHSAASPDSELNPVDAIRALKAKGLGVAFTEHVDFVTPNEGRDMSAQDAPRTTLGDFNCDLEIYPSQYRPIRKQYADSVLLGVEIGLNVAYFPLNSQVADGDYDFVLGAIHYVDGLDIYHSSDEMEPGDLCRRYLTYGREMVEYCGFFDSFAHIDYIARYNTRVMRIFKYDSFPQEFDALLKTLADRDLALEINTSRFGNNKLVGQLQPIYKRFRELGGRYVTIGSDAHNEYSLGRYYAEALGLANMTGLTPVYYRERKRYVCER